MVPHLTTTTTTTERRRSYSNNFAASTPTSFKFPDFDDQAIESEGDDTISRGPSPKPLYNGLPPGLHSSERWPARKQRDPANRTWSSWANGRLGGGRKSRQKSLSEAIRTVRTRKASVSDSAREIAESLKAPVSLRLVVRRKRIWYVHKV